MSSVIVPASLRKLSTRGLFIGTNAWLCYLAAIDFIGHMLVSNNYGYFRDELYYIVSGKHLAFGYVDFPPMIALLAALMNSLAGDALVAIHVIPAAASAVLVWLTGLMARELGGRRFAQVLAALGTLVAITFLSIASIFSMDMLDALWWGVCAYIFMRIIRRNRPGLWLVFGLVAGVGLATKLTILFFAFALVIGLLLTSSRSHLRSRWPWVGGGLPSFSCCRVLPGTRSTAGRQSSSGSTTATRVADHWAFSSIRS